MAMLLRTRKIKIALGLKIFTLLSVTLIYLISSDITDREQRSTHLHEGYGENYNVRQLLSIGNDSNCTPPAIFDFPPDGFTRTQRQQGWVIIHASIACYLFILLAVVCDDYFVPAIKKFCDSLHMKEDIAGATFMATASSSPELFINCVGTFVTEGDLGVGTIVGSAVFNILAVPACCGLCANMVVQLEWWPISRDSMIYGIAVVLLITVLEDGKVHMYEALCLVLVYIFYILMMCFNTSISAAMHKIVAKCKRRNYYKEIVTEAHPLLKKDDLKSNGNIEHSTNDIQSVGKDTDDLEESTKIWEWPGDHTFKGKCWWMFTWPISFILFLTTPDCRKYPKLYVMTFIMCVIWIGTTSYMVAWLITIIGDTLNIPDSVMGLTFLAAGTSVPEAVSSIIVTNQGHGGMGLSSSIGSNTFDILLCLGIPWFVKSAFYPKELGKHFIKINSGGLTYSAIALLATLVMFYSSLWINKFKLDWKVGLSCLLCYSGFLLLASLIELNYFMPVNFPTCDR